MISRKKEKKLLMDILKAPKFPKNNNVVLSPKSYAQLFKDLGSRAKIKIRASKMKPGEKRKVI